MKIVVAQLVLFIAISTSLRSIFARSPASYAQPRYHLKFILGEENLGPWKEGILSAAAQAPGPGNDAPTSTLVLAAKRTNRPDILHGFRQYRGGWDIANKHYWASVGFTGAAGFILAFLWFITFGLALLDMSDNAHCLHMCCSTLRNVTEYLSLAKTINVAEVFLPSNVKDDIDKLNVDLNTAADTLTEKTNENSGKIRRVFKAVRSALITVAAVMLLLSLIGLFMSVLGHRHAIHIFIISGWLLVSITFILCGVFVILDSAISDTCMAMGEWVDNSHAETALSNILPCVDQRTTNQTLIQSKQVINDIVNIVDQFIDNFANSNPPPQANSNYYNQSGPPMPRLCYPYDHQLQDSPCSSQDVSMANASLVWQNYTCTMSASGLCTSIGRLTPNMYGQLVAAVNISFALEHYTPPLLSFQDCNFVRDTFRNITSGYCPPLEHHLRMVNAGLALISVGVMLCLALWLFYANRPQREEVFAKLSLRIKSSCNSKNSCNEDVFSRSTTPRTGV
ncbi:hypothetical protein F0562_032580 [Nyssa sinensis]|uniref:Uncharacterized protein n=1 Tax=Nyssa sinensis TaxID=561372 RepID=A0A5J5AQK1_9ASTE|nr:hypothetical protein F0562_032580 [Nyssa sinensis]